MRYFDGRFSSRGVGVLVLLLFMFLSSPAYSNEIQTLKDQINQMNEQLKAMQERLENLEQTNQKKEVEIKELQEKTADIDEIDERLNQAELHTATDKLSFGLDFRVRGDSIHYENARVAPSSLVSAFFTPWASGGFNGATLPQIQGAIAGMKAAGLIPGPDKFDASNDIIYTTRVRLNMKARVNRHLSFAGRLASYKVWGDSSGVKYNQGSLGDVTMDGNTASLPHGDSLVVERAYFNYKNQIGKLPFNLSLGRRPATEGPPLEYRNYSLEGGSPLANIINWQFDGASLTFNLEDSTDIPGAEFKMCYGVGFEGDWGNSYSMINRPDVDDVHLAGFIATPYNDDVTSIVLNYAHAWDITDGFTGLTVMPFIVSKDSSTGTYSFTQNSGGFTSRIQPYTAIGDWDAASLLVRTQISDIDLFLTGALSHTDPSRISKNPFYEIMGQGLLSSNGDLESHTGFAIWAGALFPMPLDARLGVEYNWGSKYWFPFTGAEDTLIASKAAARGSVVEAYYIQPIYDDNFFLKLGGQYYDYKYTGSGNPMGKPVKISDADALDTMNQVIDKVWALYLSTTLRF